MTTTKKQTSKMVRTHEGGYRKEHRTHGVMVDVLDPKVAEAAVLKVFAAQWGTTLATVRKEGWRMDAPLVMAKNYVFDKDSYVNPETSYGVVCTEGVGHTTKSNGLVKVPIVIGMGGWTQYVEIAPKVLLMCLSGEQVDLADFVRGFGDRLESNFSIWFRAFTPSE